MVELCNYCGEMHDVGDGLMLGGVVWKSCPQVPQDRPMMFKTIYDNAVSRPFGLSEDVKRQVETDWKTLRRSTEI